MLFLVNNDGDGTNMSDLEHECEYVNFFIPIVIKDDGDPRISTDIFILCRVTLLCLSTTGHLNIFFHLTQMFSAYCYPQQKI